MEKLYTEDDIIKLMDWYRQAQWSGGNGDKQKILFVKGDHKELFKIYLKQKDEN